MAHKQPQRDWTRIVGITLIGTGVLGILISVMGLIFVAVAGAAATGALSRELGTLDQALTTTSDGLRVADQSLSEARTTLGSLSTTLGNAATAITETQPAISAIQELTGAKLPETIDATQTALVSAQETARIVDEVLSTLSIFGVRYNPDVPLNEAIGEVAVSLGTLNPSLVEVSAGIGTANQHITTVAGDLAEVAIGLEAIAVSIDEATTVIAQYQAVVRDLSSELARVREAAPAWITAVSLGLSLLMIWLGLAQIGPLTQGWALLQRAKRSRA